MSKVLGAAGRGIALQDSIRHGLRKHESTNRFFKELLNRAFDGNSLFKKGLGYAAEYWTGKLRVVAWEGCDPTAFSLDFDREGNAFQFSAARALLLNKPYFSRYPETDHNIHQTGLDRFKIKGSLIAVPVRVDTKLDSIIFFALVLWTTDGQHLHPSDVDPVVATLEDIASLTIRNSTDLFS